LEAGGAVHRASADVERRLDAGASTLLHRGELELVAAAAAAVEVVVGRHRQATANLVAVATARLHHTNVDNVVTALGIWFSKVLAFQRCCCWWSRRKGNNSDVLSSKTQCKNIIHNILGMGCSTIFRGIKDAEIDNLGSFDYGRCHCQWGVHANGCVHQSIRGIP